MVDDDDDEEDDDEEDEEDGVTATAGDKCWLASDADAASDASDAECDES